ncbi:hypothetical protein [Methanoplanus limicola]|uniref:Uncharacterized protein n=1 Tax=Methanoplanus limicola DSM 2279 TaxID=937775 RepID=H1YZH7_9EURY|nr:hypothetical protein [Methanoplanus limicola]EHQ36086.1 hypothetical protein Metlim_1997 [Methanoplanus limicola DSM 2279]
MNVDIRDTEVLNALGPLDLELYLKSRGWNESFIMPDKYSVWITRDGNNEEYEITLPLDRTVIDYALRIGELLNTLELAENRSQTEIYNDLKTTSADIIRLKFSLPNSSGGSIPIEKGVEIVNNVWGMMMASACSTIEPRPIFQARKPNQAVDYMKKVRLGQTEQGSYVVTVLSPVSPEINIKQTKLLNAQNSEDPFERKVILNLSTALAEMKYAAERAAVKSSFEYFEDAIEKGVSANLCEAVARLSSYNDQYQDLYVSFSLSRNRPAIADVVKNVYLSADIMPVLDEVARVFRESAPRDDFEVRGPVIRLERNEGSSAGKITVIAFIDEKPRKISFELPDELYHLAVQAHDQEKTIACYGTLVREGRTYFLKNPGDLMIERE